MFLFFIFVQTLFSAAFIVTKMALDHMDPYLLSFLRMFLAAIPMTIYYLFLSKAKYKFNKTDAILLCGVAFFNVFITNLYETLSLIGLKAATANFIYSLSPLITAVMGYFGVLGLKENFNWKKVVGLLISFFGFLSFILGNSSGGVGGVSKYEAYILLATFGTTIGWVLVKRLVERGVPIALISSFSMMGGAFLAFVTYLVFGHKALISDLNTTLIWGGATALVSFLLAYNLKKILLKLYSATFTAIGIFVSPLATAALGYFILGEKISLMFFVALGLIFVGTYIFFTQE